ncbi:Floral homeotic protein AGAMOUS [Asimina triloba]
MPSNPETQVIKPYLITDSRAILVQLHKSSCVTIRSLSDSLLPARGIKTASTDRDSTKCKQVNFVAFRWKKHFEKLHLMGEALSSMTVKDLKQLENRLEKGISRIRSKKNELLFAEIEYMQKREIDLQNDNMYLRAKIAENERAQQHMNMLPPAQEYEVMPAFDSRNFLPVNALEPNHHYSHQEQTALQLG